MKIRPIPSMSPLALLALLARSWSHPGPAASAPAVRWRELVNPVRAAHVMVRDTRRDRGIIIGEDLDYDEPRKGVWRSVEQPALHWEPLAVLGDGPTECSAGSGDDGVPRGHVTMCAGTPSRPIRMSRPSSAAVTAGVLGRGGEPSSCLRRLATYGMGTTGRPRRCSHVVRGRGLDEAFAGADANAREGGDS